MDLYLSIIYFLQQQCSALMREKEAVHTIMERKIKVLVESVAQALDVLIRDPSKSSSLANGPVHALAKVLSEFLLVPIGVVLFTLLFMQDVAALHRLVNASVSALRNSHASARTTAPRATDFSTSDKTVSPGNGSNLIAKSVAPGSGYSSLSHGGDVSRTGNYAYNPSSHFTEKGVYPSAVGSAGPSLYAKPQVANAGCVHSFDEGPPRYLHRSSHDIK